MNSQIQIMQNVRVLSKHERAWFGSPMHVWWGNCVGHYISVFSDKIFLKVKLFIHIVEFECQNITVSMMKYFLGNHKCPPQYLVECNN